MQRRFSGTNSWAGCCTLNDACESCCVWVTAGLKRWTTPAVPAFRPFGCISQHPAHLNEAKYVDIYHIRGHLKTSATSEKLNVDSFWRLLINYGHFSQEWSKFGEVAIKIIVSLPDWLLDSVVPSTFSLLFHRLKNCCINREKHHQISCELQL